MKTTTSILLSLALALVFVSCNSDTPLSPANDLAPEIGRETELTKAAALTSATLELRPQGALVDWLLEARLSSQGNGQMQGRGRFKIILKGGIVFIPVGGGVRLRQNASGEVDIQLQFRTQQGSNEQVRLRFRGSGTNDPAAQSITGSGNVQGGFSLPDLRGKLNGPAQIAIDYTGAG